MQYTKLGRTGIDVSRISMGCQRFADPKDHDKHLETIVHAYNQGINFFDTAHLYCEDQSEIILGKAIEEMQKGDQPFYISSKCMAGDEKGFRERLETSLRRLNLDCIDFFTCLWGVKSYRDWQEARRFSAFDLMLKAKEEGLIRHIGLTTHIKSEEHAAIMADYDFDLNITTLNVINARERLAGVEAAHASGAGIVAMNPIGTGKVLLYPEIFEGILLREGQSLVQAAYDFVLSLPQAHSVLGGFSEKAHVDQAVQALDKHQPYTQDQIQKVYENMKQRITSLDLEKRRDIAMDLCKMMYILRDEVAALMDVYTMSIWRS